MHSACSLERVSKVEVAVTPVGLGATTSPKNFALQIMFSTAVRRGLSLGGLAHLAVVAAAPAATAYRATAVAAARAVAAGAPRSLNCGNFKHHHTGHLAWRAFSAAAAGDARAVALHPPAALRPAARLAASAAGRAYSSAAAAARAPQSIAAAVVYRCTRRKQSAARAYSSAAAIAHPLVAGGFSAERQVGVWLAGRAIHSFPFQLNVSNFEVLSGDNSR